MKRTTLFSASLLLVFSFILLSCRRDNGLFSDKNCRYDGLLRLELETPVNGNALYTLAVTGQDEGTATREWGNTTGEEKVGMGTHYVYYLPVELYEQLQDSSLLTANEHLPGLIKPFENAISVYFQEAVVEWEQTTTVPIEWYQSTKAVGVQLDNKTGRALFGFKLTGYSASESYDLIRKTYGVLKPFMFAQHPDLASNATENFSGHLWLAEAPESLLLEFTDSDHIAYTLVLPKTFEESADGEAYHAHIILTDDLLEEYGAISRKYVYEFRGLEKHYNLAGKGDQLLLPFQPVCLIHKYSKGISIGVEEESFEYSYEISGSEAISIVVKEDNSIEVHASPNHEKSSREASLSLIAADGSRFTIVFHQKPGSHSITGEII